MKRSLFFSLVLAASIPGLAMASVATDQANRSLQEPLSTKTTAPQRLTVATVDNSLGQSDAMTRSLYYIADNTDQPTDLPVDERQSSAPQKPLDW